MAFDVIHKAAMIKLAELGTEGMYQYGGTYLPTAAKGTSYIPETQQRISNMGNYLKTKLNDTAGKYMRGLAKTVLPGSAYDVARDTWHEFMGKESPVDKAMGYVDKGLRSEPVKGTLKSLLPERAYNWVREMGKGGLKPARRVERFKDAIHADKYVNPDTVEELPFKPGTLEHKMWLEQKRKQENPYYRERPTKGLKNIYLPEGDRLTNMAMAEAKSKRYDHLRFQGYNDKEITQMLLEEYYKPALVQATGDNNINQYTQVNDDQWNKFKDALINREMAYRNADPNLGYGHSEAQQDATRAGLRSNLDELWNNSNAPIQSPSNYVDWLANRTRPIVTR